MKKCENEWRETVRDIYDGLHFGKFGVEGRKKLQRKLIDFIEKRHHDYFCEVVKKGRKK